MSPLYMPPLIVGGEGTDTNDLWLDKGDEEMENSVWVHASSRWSLWWGG